MMLDGPEQARYMRHIPYVGYVYMALRVRWVQVLVIGLPALALAGYIGVTLWRLSGEAVREERQRLQARHRTSRIQARSRRGRCHETPRRAARARPAAALVAATGTAERRSPPTSRTGRRSPQGSSRSRSSWSSSPSPRTGEGATDPTTASGCATSAPRGSTSHGCRCATGSPRTGVPRPRWPVATTRPSAAIGSSSPSPTSRTCSTSADHYVRPVPQRESRTRASR